LKEIDYDFTHKSTSGQLEKLYQMPIPDELKPAIKEILLNDKKARDEINRLGILEFVKRHGGEIRMKKNEHFENLQIDITNVVVEAKLDQKIELDLIEPIMQELNYLSLKKEREKMEKKQRIRREKIEKKEGKFQSYKIRDKNSRIVVYESGKIASTLNKTVEDGKEDMERLLEKIKAKKIGKVTYFHVRVWQKAELGHKLRLETVKPILQDIRQETGWPEWVGLYRPDSSDGSKGPNIALFESGRMVAAGSPSLEAGRKDIYRLVNKLKKIKVI
jgi:TATA-box binding protein (TBP) (component of TFIID and TFIIIB)